MKAAKQQRRTVGNASSTQNNVDTGIGCNTTKRPRKESASKKSGQSNSSLTGEYKLSLPPSTALALSEQFPIKEASVSEKTNNMFKLEQPGQKLCPFTKIKIQLFPIDEVTQKGLEKDGYNPYLELTVSNRKKISSVLKHLKSKWGNSTVALGDLMLFPYNIQMENLAAYRRWSLEDTDTSADVYAAIGCPGIFRLRYGWLSSPESKTFCIPLTTSGARSQHENCMNIETSQVEKQPCKTVDQECRSICTSNMPSSAQNKSIPLDRATEPLDNFKSGYGLTLSSSLWADTSTNISIGALLSEASLQAATKRSDLVSAGGDLCLQQTPFSCDSFDAAIAAYLHGRPQGLQQFPRTSHSSILDAEETCHAFSYQKLLSSGIEVPFSSRSAASGSCSRDATSNPFKFPNAVKANSQAGMQDYILHGTKADPPPNTQGEGDNVASSLGMANVSCLISGDSISLGGLLANSLDPWKNWSRDGKVAPA